MVDGDVNVCIMTVSPLTLDSLNEVSNVNMQIATQNGQVRIEL